MAARASWKGYLKLSLVSCPVRLYTAVSRSGKVSFNLLHKDTHNRIQMKTHDPELGEVDRSDLVKGYEYEKDHYVILTDEDFDTIKIETTHTMTIERFVDAKEVDGIYLDAPYYLAPDGAVAEETFSVIRDAMEQKHKVAISRVVLSGRERTVAITVRDKGFLVLTLRDSKEVRDHRPYFEAIGDGKPDQEMLDLAVQLIDQKSGAFEPSAFHDRYEEALLDVIKAKVKGEQLVVADAPERGKVINLMDALKQSLLREQEKKPPAESRRRKPAAGAGTGRTRKKAEGGG